MAASGGYSKGVTGEFASDITGTGQKSYRAGAFNSTSNVLELDMGYEEKTVSG